MENNDAGALVVAIHPNKSAWQEYCTKKKCSGRTDAGRALAVCWLVDVRDGKLPCEATLDNNAPYLYFMF